MLEKQNSKTIKHFSSEEDIALKNLVEQIGLTEWKKNRSNHE